MALWQAAQQAQQLADILARELKYCGYDRRLATMLEVAQCMEYDLRCRRTKAGYNPDQPRVPAGNPDGGQWTSGSGSGTGSDSTYHGDPDLPIEPVYPVEEAIGALVGGVGVGALRRGLGRGLAGIESLSANQAKNLIRFEKRLPAGAGPTKIINSRGGSKIFRADVPAKNISGSFARYEKTVDASGKTLKYIKATYAPDGTVVHTKVKFP